MADNSKTGTNTQQDTSNTDNTKDPQIYLDIGGNKDALDIKLNDLIIGERIVVPLNPESKNEDVKEFTRFLLHITDSKNLRILYEKIVIEEWRIVIAKAFGIGRSPNDKLQIVADPNNTQYGYKKYCIDVTFKPIITDPALKTNLDKYLDETLAPNITLTVVRFVFSEDPNLFNNQLAVRLGLIGYAYIDKIAAEKYKKKIEDQLAEEIKNEPIVVQEINAKMVNSVNKIEPTKTEEKTANDVLKEVNQLKKIIETSQNSGEIFLYRTVIIASIIGVVIYFAMPKNKNNIVDIVSKDDKKSKKSILVKLDKKEMGF